MVLPQFRIEPAADINPGNRCGKKQTKEDREHLLVEGRHGEMEMTKVRSSKVEVGSDWILT
jgi:hypothetical protein